MNLLKSVVFVVPFSVYVASMVSEYAEPGKCTGSCNLHDPGLIRREHDGKWFKFSSHDLIHYSSADDIAGPWTDVGSVLVNKSVIDLPGNTDIWAPDVHKYGDMYYCFYGVGVGDQNSAIGIAVSPTMELGTWVDKGAILSSKSGDPYNAIDSGFIVTEDDKMYMTFGSFWDGIYITEMASPEKPIGTPIRTAYNNTGGDKEEASYLYYHNGYYYLFFSSGICCNYNYGLPEPGEEYRINVCRSKSITGPYVDADGVECTNGGGTTVYASHGKIYGPGGQQVYNNILYYHYVDTDVGNYADRTKYFGWNELKWENDWPSV